MLRYFTELPETLWGVKILQLAIVILYSLPEEIIGLLEVSW